jgi:hypothetical protein
MPWMTQEYVVTLLNLNHNFFSEVRSNRQITRRDANQIIHTLKNLVA